MFKSTFTGPELVLLYDQYFYQRRWEETYFEIESKNTNHYWMIIKESPYMQEGAQNITVLHKHNYRQKYHVHMHCNNVTSAIKKIKSHDKYVLTKYYGRGYGGIYY